MIAHLQHFVILRSLKSLSNNKKNNNTDNIDGLATHAPVCDCINGGRHFAASELPTPPATSPPTGWLYGVAWLCPAGGVTLLVIAVHCYCCCWCPLNTWTIASLSCAVVATIDDIAPLGRFFAADSAWHDTSRSCRGAVVTQTERAYSL